MRKLLHFTDTPQKRPDLASAEERKQHFDEIYAPFDPEKAAEQASRCSQCGVPFCQVHCPLSNNIPDWLKLATEGRLEDAYAVSSATNNFPEICGRICPQDKLCEGNCVIERDFESVTIGQVEKYITETAFEQGWVKPINVVQENGMSVGIIGAGPAGLAAGEELRKKGYSVHIYDRYDRVGGLMIYGIPNFKLEKSVVARREALLRESGIEFHLECTIGKDIKINELQDNHDAILIATGVYKARELDITHEASVQPIPALTFLTASNRKGLGDAVKAYEDGELNAHGKNVVVIGGGDTAMDCVRTAVRQQAKSVTCLYRRDRDNMPGSAREVKHAEEEGVVFKWLSAPKALAERQIIAEQMQLGAPDSSGRCAPVPTGDTFSLNMDMLVTSLGFIPEDIPTLFDCPELTVTKWGTLMVDHQMMTSAPGIFAAGDIARGASLVVWAIKDGRDAAEAIHTYCSGQSAIDTLKSLHDGGTNHAVA